MIQLLSWYRRVRKNEYNERIVTNTLNVKRFSPAGSSLARTTRVKHKMTRGRVCQFTAGRVRRGSLRSPEIKPIKNNRKKKKKKRLQREQNTYGGRKILHDNNVHGTGVSVSHL